MPINGPQKRHLRALAHHVQPLVHVGEAGLSEGVVGEVRSALAAHELIKVKFGENSPDQARDAGAGLAQTTHADLVQVIGRMVVLYRRHPHEPKIELPKRKR